MKGIGCRWITFYQTGTAHLLLLLLAVVLHNFSGCFGEPSEDDPKYIFYTTNYNKGSVCSGPFTTVNNSNVLCGLKQNNCKGMTTSCFQRACGLISRQAFNRKQRSFSQENSLGFEPGLEFDLNGSIKMLDAGKEAQLCCSDNREQINWIEILINDRVLSKIDKKICETSSNNTKYNDNKEDANHFSNIADTNDKRQSQTSQYHSSNWTSLLAMMATITVLVFITVLALFYKFKLVKCKEKIDCIKENEENIVHDYEEITLFPQRPTTDNFYHTSNVPTSYDNGALESTYSELQIDQTLNSNNEPTEPHQTPQQQTNTPIYSQVNKQKNPHLSSGYQT